MSDQHQPEISDTELVELLGSLQADDLQPAAPPPSVWSGIEQQLSSATNPARPDSPSDATVVPLDRGAHVALADRRSNTALRWLAAAAALVLVVSGGFLVLRRGNAEPRVVATAQLQHEDGFDALGATARASATLLERDGQYQIKLADPQLPTDLGESADLELWLIEKRDDGSLDVQPVAVIDNGDGTFAVPAGLDPTTHDIVDISIEPRDGDATHSGRSILRGALQQA